MPLPVTITYEAFDTSANVYKTGDAANHTLKVVADGVEATPAASPVALTGGRYKIALAAAENSGRMMELAGTSSTANVIILPTKWQNDPGSSAATPLVPIVIDNGTNANALTDQQFSVTLTANNVDWANLVTGGDNLRVYDADNVLVPYWIETAIDTAAQTGSIVVKVASVPAYSVVRLRTAAAAADAPVGSDYDGTMHRVDPLNPIIREAMFGRDASTATNGTWSGLKGVYTATNTNERGDGTSGGVGWRIDAPGTTAGTGAAFSGSRSVRVTGDTGPYYWIAWAVSGVTVPDEFSISFDWKHIHNAAPGRNGFWLLGWDNIGADKGIRVQSPDGYPNVQCSFVSADGTVTIDAPRGTDGEGHRGVLTFKKCVNAAIPTINGKYVMTVYCDGKYISETIDPLTMPDLSAAKLYLFSHWAGTDLRCDLEGDRFIFYERALNAEEVEQDWQGKKMAPGTGPQSRMVRTSTSPVPVDGMASDDPTAEEPHLFIERGRTKKYRLWYDSFGSVFYSESADRVTWTAGVQTNIFKEHVGIVRNGSFYYLFAPNNVSGMKIYRTPVSGDGLTWTDTGGTVPYPSWGNGPSANACPFPVGNKWCVIVEAQNSSNIWKCGMFTADDILGPYTEQGGPSARFTTLMTDPALAAVGINLASFSNFAYLFYENGLHHFLFHGSRTSSSSNVYHAYTTDPLTDSAWQMDYNPVIQLGDRVWAVDQLADPSPVYDRDAGELVVMVSAMNNNGADVTGRIYEYAFAGTPAQWLAPVVNPLVGGDDLSGGADGTSGNGAFARTVTVTASSTPISGAIVAMSTAAIVYSAATNTSGVASFSLDRGDYTLTVSKAGYQHTPQSVTVRETGDTATTIVAVTITPATDPSRTTGYITVYDSTGARAAGVSIAVQLIGGVGTAGQSHYDDEISGTSDTNGLVQIPGLLRGARYHARRGTEGDWIRFTAASAATTPLPEVLGHE